MSSQHLNLTPALVESGKGDDLIKHGQSIRATFSPLNNSLAVFVAPARPPQPGAQPSEENEQAVSFASLELVPRAERRLFITDTLVIFAALQNLLKSSEEHEEGWLQQPQNLTMIRKLSIDYVNFIKECWIHASRPENQSEEPFQFPSNHYRSVYTCFTLFVILYLAEPGYENAPIGDELMEWLNTHWIEPSTEDGDHLSSLERPWEDENFWPYLTRSIMRGLSKASLFFLGTLSQHPSEDLQDLADALIPLIETHPRLQNFDVERDFVHASRRWLDKVKALRITMDRVPESERSDEFENWWDRLSDIVGILEGRSEVVKRVCFDLGADWKEVCAVWGIFVENTLRRSELTDVVLQVLDEMPPDPTSLEDVIHVALLSDQPLQALQHAAKLDCWLSAHLADIMQPTGLIEDSVDEESGLSLRDQYVLAYAEYLHSDYTLWRLTVDYMYSCSEIGKRRADEVLLRVPLRIHEQASNKGDKNIKTGDIVGVLKDVNETCFQYQREAVRRTVCRIAAQSLVQDKDYALAVAYCTSAEDWTGLGRVVNQVLDEYVVSGPKAFARSALAIAPSIQELRNQVALRGIFIHRLIFAVRFAHFLQLRDVQEYQEAASDLMTMFRDEEAPTSWWAVLLSEGLTLLQHGDSPLFSVSDATELLRKVEEIFTRISQGSRDEYLSILRRTLKGSDEDALERLKLVRLALAKYFARCTIWGLSST
ncbi:hypothetical protein AX16_007062 [Volvariella volvacea WC 439]|nr:hypothetical protein AX16_007062 [Volvariella volvacea WC 439]